jgi:excisionase family DNA binding protein
VGQILTVKELAKYIKLTTVTIYKYVKVGTIPAHKIGGVWRFDKDQIDELIKSEEEVKRIK